MSVSNAFIYCDVPNNRWTLQMERNFIIEDIEEYLATKVSYEFRDIMYQKNELNIELKLSLSQAYTQPAYNTAVRYVKIVDSDTNTTYYYYVTECVWTSESAIKLYLHLDTLNTFPYGDASKGYEVSAQTHITRQHKDRITHDTYERTWDSSALFTFDVSLERTISTFQNIYNVIWGESTTNTINDSFPITSIQIDGETYDAFKSGSLKVNMYQTSTTSIKVTTISYATESVTIGPAPDNPTGTYEFKCLKVPSIAVTYNRTGKVVSYVEQVTSSRWEAGVTIYFDEEQPDDLLMSELLSGKLSSFQVGQTTSLERTYNIYYNKMTLSYSGNSTTTYNYHLASASMTLNFTDAIPDISHVNAISFTVNGSSWRTTLSYFSDIASEITTGGEESETRTYYRREIDWFPEEINPPLYKQSEEDILDSAGDMSWYLIARNQTDTEQTTNHPIVLDLCSDSQVQVIGEYKGEINASTLTNKLKTSRIILGEGKGKMISSAWRNLFYTSTYNDDTTTLKNGITTSALNNAVVILVYLYVIDGQLYMQRLVQSNGTYQQYEIFTESAQKIDYIHVPDSASVSYTTYSKAFDEFNAISNGTQTNYTIGNRRFDSFVPTQVTTSQSTDYHQITALQEVDRTNTQIVKIVQTPYQFTNAVLENGVYFFGDGTYLDTWKWEEGNVTYTFIGIDNPNGLHNHVISLTTNPLFDATLTSLDIDDGSLFDLDGEISNLLESKLLHSEFYYQKAVYDSFSFIFALENINIPNYADITNTLEFDFFMTGTTNSMFMFMFDIDWKYTQEDYENILVVSRNNEIPIYSSDYITYMNDGYNFDKKNKNAKITQGWINTAMEALNPLSWITNPVGTATQTIAGITGQVTGELTTENNFNKKILQTQYNPTSVYGSDDIDLLNAYSNNRMKLTKYAVSNEWRRKILALFHYAGYRCDIYGVPVTDTRTRFNFIQAEIVFDSVLNFSSAMKSDIIGKWKQGVYFIHHYNKEWDTTLKYENYEVSLIGE